MRPEKYTMLQYSSFTIELLIKRWFNFIVIFIGLPGKPWLLHSVGIDLFNNASVMIDDFDSIARKLGIIQLFSTSLWSVLYLLSGVL